MRRTNQALLWVGMGVLSLTPCALGRSIREDYTALRGVSNITAREDLMWLGGKSIFLDTDRRVGRTLAPYGHHSTVEHDGHATMPGRNWSGNGGNPGNAPDPGPIGIQNGTGSGPGGNFVYNGPPPNMPGGNFMPGGSSEPPSDPINLFFVPGGNNAPSGNNSVPEGGAAASYVVPAGFVAFAGIFLTGFRRRDQANF